MASKKECCTLYCTLRITREHKALSMVCLELPGSGALDSPHLLLSCLFCTFRGPKCGQEVNSDTLCALISHSRDEVDSPQ